jgi:hypothetical protein
MFNMLSRSANSYDDLTHGEEYWVSNVYANAEREHSKGVFTGKWMNGQPVFKRENGFVMPMKFYSRIVEHVEGK